MPCLNESETLEVCITKAQNAMRCAGVRGEVVIADNGTLGFQISIAAFLLGLLRLRDGLRPAPHSPSDAKSNAHLSGVDCIAMHD
jgi:hypothetical protein